MKATIILFSPSGNTLKAGEQLQTSLENHGVATQLVNITGDREYFGGRDQKRYLQQIVREHDLLFLGAPVYVHHFQYHMTDLIGFLPQPGNGWGKSAVPFVTYGGIHSGIALDEAGRLLKKSGRNVPAGLKISASHRVTRAFMKEEFNQGRPEEESMREIERLVKALMAGSSVQDNSKKLRYQSLSSYFKANFIFVEKTWHEKRYPKISIDEEKCKKCGKCLRLCPVCHLEKASDGSITGNPEKACIHCFNCVLGCPEQAVSPMGELEKAKTFMNRMIEKAGEVPATSMYPHN